jgi:hypothetical protein
MKPHVKRGAKYSCLAVAGTATVSGGFTAGLPCGFTEVLHVVFSPPIHWRVTYWRVIQQQRVYFSGLV